ncbi:hypothetical protein OIU34_19100 [Pararhizobium sp. BT-229]|uniref:hypothetical protein n=1 Tax=Pararhizobium sp. BT-229 TaxID=2986923 RepID=UPI0021F69FCB|nr:hypothetical protein [Pararhizobium sp. BT-229]MCV9963990.1 hypothetical protein [Pararhizobium sp. BT-229]
MLIYGRLKQTDQEISSATRGIDKGPWFEKAEDAAPGVGEVMVTAELENGWADWIATRLAADTSKPTSEVKLFPGAKFTVISIEG